MYRLSGPRIIFFTPLLVISVFIIALIPHYFVQFRIMSLFSMIAGEIALSFIPVIVLYPKASITQASILALIYLLMTLITCVGGWSINTFGWPGQYSFLLKGQEFHINTYALFASNVLSLILLTINFKLYFDEDSSKRVKSPKNYQGTGNLGRSRSPSLSRPDFGAKKESKKQVGSQEFKVKEGAFSEDYLEPFTFEPELDVAELKLPEESSGSLYSEQKTTSDIKSGESDFFEEDKPVETTKPIQLSPFPPSSIKDDLSAIFEQYSSLDAVKKITSTKRTPSRKRTGKESGKISPLESTKESEEIFEATFRTVSEEEKIEEMKQSLKKEIEEEISKKTENPEKEIKIETLKDELIKSLKSELKKELITSEQYSYEPDDVILEENLNIINENLSGIDSSEKIELTTYITSSGQLLPKKSDKLPDNEGQNIVNLFNQSASIIRKTNQGNLLDLLLESENGILLIVNQDGQFLTVKSSGTSENHIGQLLKTLSEVEEI